MDAIAASHTYVDRIIKEPAGMKALVLDEETVHMVSVVYSQSQILEKEVFLVENLRASHERMAHLSAVCFVRPTDENVRVLCAELADPKYGQYFIYFSSFVRHDQLQRLADADERELVRSVQEVFLDFTAINEDMFTLDIKDSMAMCVPRVRWGPPQETMFDRTCRGLLSVLLALKKRPHIRVQASSELACTLADELNARMDQEKLLFDFRRSAVQPQLLILDRREDPATPLLSQWTYQAMVHELLGMENNMVDLSHVKGVRDEIKHAVLSATQDPFFAEHRFSNFGDLGVAVKGMLDTYSSRTQASREVHSIEDMQRFVENYGEFRKLSVNVSKHVALMSELARLVDILSLMDVSALEQSIACTSDQGAHYKEVVSFLANPDVDDAAVLRLVLLFSLRYEGSGDSQINRLKQMMLERGMPHSTVALVDVMLRYAGREVRGGDLFGNKNLASKFMSSIRRELVGVSNVYTQHSPLVAPVVESLLRGRMKDTQFPFRGPATRERPEEVIVFIVGGITFEEARAIAQLNASPESRQRIILGGTFVHNSKTFLEELSRLGGVGPIPRAGVVGAEAAAAGAARPIARRL